MADEKASDMEAVGDTLRNLTPSSEPQRALKERALALYYEGNELKWNLDEKAHAQAPAVFVTVLVFWFTLLFAAFAILAPSNPTVHAVMFLCALSVAGGILLILEMGRPFEGIIKVPSAPMEDALKNLSR